MHCTIRDDNHKKLSSLIKCLWDPGGEGHELEGLVILSECVATYMCVFTGKVWCLWSSWPQVDHKIEKVLGSVLICFTISANRVVSFSRVAASDLCLKRPVVTATDFYLWRPVVTVTDLYL